MENGSCMLGVSPGRGGIFSMHEVHFGLFGLDHFGECTCQVNSLKQFMDHQSSGLSLDDLGFHCAFGAR